MHRHFGDSPIPRYAQLAELFRQRIVRGTWCTGARLPSLDELMKEFDVARVTVRQAIGLLERDGLVSAQRGRGTFVTAQPDAPRRLRVETTLAAMVEMYRGDKPQLLNIVESSGAPALTEDDGKPAARYFHMRRVHSRDGLPYCVISIYIDHRVFRRAPERFRREVVIPVLAELPGLKIARARQTLTIGTADMEVAGHIRVPVNSPIAEVRRVFNSPDGTVMYLAEVIYRGDFIRLDMDLRA
jgi:GntR family transcriptional regulator